MEERKRNILKATISSYIETAEPVGSTKLIKEHGFNVSPATVRNELNELEKEGFLTQLHTSSGRIPTDKGYRLYVDSLMNYKLLQPKQKQQVLQSLQVIGLNVRDVLANMSGIMSSLVDYTTIVLTPDIYQETLKVAHLILLDLNKVLIVILDSLGVSKDFLIRIEDKVSQDDLNKISKLLTEKLKGKSFEEINEKLFSSLVSELPAFGVIIRSLYDEVKKIALKQKKQGKLVMSGMSNMLKLPEFQNIELTQKVISALEENKVFLGVLNEYLSSESSNNTIVIGEENKIKNLKDCSLVFSKCVVEDKFVGALGMIGPKRMTYSKIVPMVLGISDMINDYLSGKEQSGNT
jgi:heat-inducible transcriptional repressor